ncbi:hypothetical protein GPECTOR_18g10 [Gonium pectorale]|uniref:Nucleosome assembly protein n=1 Tax=Gonium pectorale TaxID=33097 RepID=A0A150GJG8_GONPE|nr:hypothetical protein GPECTOR_18g10 [Gonium pectorale]|eukprot:KXZ49941.1 hypothetical protein GPECTOR_18g10 [Gonium pectorale]
MAEKKTFAAIEAIEAQIEASSKLRQQKAEELIVEYLREREPLLQRRYELVSGKSDPTDEELQGFQPQGAAAAAAASSPGAASPVTGGGKGGSKGAAAAGKGDKPVAASRGVPFFWLNALCNQEELSTIITPRDRFALEYCEDVRYVRGPAGMAVEFHFSPNNPYFTNTVLRKGVYVKRAGDGRSGDIEEVREEATVIDWRPGRSLLVKADGPAGGDKKRGAGGAGGGKQTGGAKGGKKGKKAAAAPAARTSRKHGKHGGGPPPDLPDPDEENEQEEDDEEQEDGAGEGPAASGRRRACPSFFRFFLPIVQGDKAKKGRELDPTREGDDTEEEEEEEEEEEDQDAEGVAEGGGADAAQRMQERRARDGDILDVLVKKVVPRAVHLYMAAGGGKSGRAIGADDDDEEGFTLVSGSPAGDVAALALSTQRALHALMGLQRRLDELAAGLKAAEWAALVAHIDEVARLAAQRRSLLVGPAGATDKLSIPAFWLRALRATPVGGAAVAHRDEGALAALADVRLVWDTNRMPTPEQPTRSATLELEFLPNRWFSNKVLRRRFTFHAPGGSLNKIGVESSQADPIDWHPGADLTVRYPPGQRPGAGAGSEGQRARAKQVPSFFHYFSNAPGALCRTFNIPGQSRAAQTESSQVQEEFIGELVNVVVNFAGRLAVETKVDADDLGDEREDEDDGEDESEEEEEDEEEEGGDEEAAARRAARRAARAAGRAAGRRKVGAAGEAGEGGFLGVLKRVMSSPLLAVLVLSMFMAQLLLAQEVLDYVRAKFSWAP